MSDLPSFDKPKDTMRIDQQGEFIMGTQDSPCAHHWQAIALTWPVDYRGIATSRKLIAGTFATYGEALAAAKAKVEEIGGVGFTVEQYVIS